MIELNHGQLRVEISHSSRRRKSATLKYHSDGHFVLSVPDGVPESWVREFITSRERWMQKTRDKAENDRRSRKIQAGSAISTEFYTVVVEMDPALSYPQYKVTRDKNLRLSTFHLSVDFFAPENGQKLYEHLEKYLLAQMIKYGEGPLIERAQYWARLHNIQVKDIFVRVQQSRLGYCTHDNRIMLNGRLLFAEQKIRDYVICHELAHTRHHNHSKAYWAYLEKLFPGARVTDKLLRNPETYRLRLPG